MDNKLLENINDIVKAESSKKDMYKIIFTTEEGKDIEYEIIATFKSKANKKIYYIMTDNTRSDNNELNITAFYVYYDETKEEPCEINEGFHPVLDDDELQMVLDVFDKIKNSL